eukprot:TRINITY_DN13246_c0_g1_i2.p1 TRINITY_DN13246_c0_g1~~TRINITY_DN13246_c0_g1_i2.p1  ORF type:complete len:633 (-),score=120.05 TRINITY_DN13246_c0_g1_i2:15-1913(-)
MLGRRVPPFCLLFSFSQTISPLRSPADGGHVSSFLAAEPGPIIPALPPQPPPPRPSLGSGATHQDKVIGEIIQLVNVQREVLERMQQNLRVLLITVPIDEVRLRAVEAENAHLRNQIDTEAKSLRDMERTIIFDPTQLFKSDLILQDLRLQHRQLEIYHNEIVSVLLPTPPGVITVEKPNCALMVTKQPFPMVISKGKQLQEDQLVVQMICGAATLVEVLSPVRAELESAGKPISKGTSAISNGPSGSTKKHIERESQALDQTRGIARFPIKFLTGTRKSCVAMKFVLNAKIGGVNQLISSHHTHPFIVITNDCQWEGSEGALLKSEVFAESTEVLWPFFVNILQRHFLKATRQNPMQPARPLAMFDFNYIMDKFVNKATVNHKSFDVFWGWFGKVLQTLRYKRHITHMWQNGIIFMFMTRDRVTQILRGQEVGTFLVLFSEAYGGQLEISYVAPADARPNTPPMSPMSLLHTSSAPTLSISSPAAVVPFKSLSSPVLGGPDGSQSQQSHMSLELAYATSLSSAQLTPSSSSHLSVPHTSLSTKIKHYLVSTNDTIGSKRTLPDFLNECAQFTHILQISQGVMGCANDWQTVAQMHAPPFKRFPKDQLLESLYSKKGSSSPGPAANGYDPLE